MIVHIQPDLMERTVFDAIRKDPSLENYYHRRHAACYDEPEGDRRDLGFVELHKELFSELGFHDLVLGMAKQHPHLMTNVNRLMVTQAPGIGKLAAELYGAPGRYTVAIAITPALLQDRPAFEYWARHEFLHVEDMLDPAFGYEESAAPSGPNRAIENLVRDRYAVIWGISCDARLELAGRLPEGIRQRRQDEFLRVFRLSGELDASRRFESLWTQCTQSRPTHGRMLDEARGGAGVDVDGRQDGSHPNLPGVVCPLCNFPTFHWAQHHDLVEVATAVRHSFPTWTPEEGACGRCLEVYQVA